MTFRLTRFTTIAMTCAALLFAGCGKSSEKSGSKTASENGDKTKLTQATKLPPAVNPEGVVMVDITPKELQEAIAERKGQAILVDFWATWCGPCKKAFPHSLKLSKEYAEKGLVVMTVSIDNYDSRAEALMFLKGQDAKLLNYFTSDQIPPDAARFKAWQITEDKGIPCYRIYKPDGTLLKEIYGGDKSAEIDAAVHEALGLK